MEANIAFPASLIGDPVRAAILTALCDGRAQPASALARAAGVTPQCASNHLSKLLDGELVLVERQGRHRYYRLASADVARAIESLAHLAPPPFAVRTRPPASAKGLLFARSCYDHLAGSLGVAIAARLEDRGFLLPAAPSTTATVSKTWAISEAGREWSGRFGIDLPRQGSSSQILALKCLDWTERRHHLAGPFGKALLKCFVDLAWMRRSKRTRAITVTPLGIAGLRNELALDVRTLTS